VEIKLAPQNALFEKYISKYEPKLSSQVHMNTPGLQISSVHDTGKNALSRGESTALTQLLRTMNFSCRAIRSHSVRRQSVFSVACSVANLNDPGIAGAIEIETEKAQQRPRRSSSVD
jgi:hypothetical protein